MDVFRIVNWEKHFENSRSRQIQNLAWVLLPNKHDGDGYTELVDCHPEGPLHYAAWVTLLQVASKCTPRGTLLRGTHQAHDSLSVSRMTRIPQKVYDEAIPRLLEIGWLECISLPDNNLQPACQVGDGLLSGTRQGPDKQLNRTEGTEPKGTEPNGNQEPVSFALLDQLIDGWNMLAFYDNKPPKVQARRSKPIVDGWSAVQKDTEARELFASPPKVIEKIKEQTWLHTQGFFRFPWLFCRGKTREWNIQKIMGGAYVESGNGQQSKVGPGQRHPDDANREEF